MPRKALLSALALLPVVLAAALASGGAQAQGKQDFTLVNRTGYQIDEVYVGPVNSSKWGEDVMGEEAIDDGESANITFTGRSKACEWDIRVVYADGDDAEFHGVDLCDVSTVTLYWNRKSGETRFETE